MTFSFYALDNEFAASSGANVNSGAGTSTFDYPPNSTKDLVVTTNPGDTTPTVFSIGDSYDLTWGGMGGGGSVQDAVVIRSDLAPNGTGGIVVFEGYDNGDLVQIVWTPGYNLENWYWSNFSGGRSPGFYTTDQNPNYTHSYVCFVRGTRITTPRGQVAIEDLKVGDLVLTRDHGLQPVRWVGGKASLGLGRAAPVHFAPGSIGNDRPLLLSQQHRVLVTSAQAELYFFSAEVLVPAKSLVNGTSVRIIPTGRVVYYHLLFDQHEIVWAEGVQAESLLLAGESTRHLDPQAAAEEAALLPDLSRTLRPGHTRAARPVLTHREALLVADSMTIPSAPLPVLDAVF